MTLVATYLAGTTITLVVIYSLYLIWAPSRPTVWYLVILSIGLLVGMGLAAWLGLPALYGAGTGAFALLTDRLIEYLDSTSVAARVPSVPRRGR